MSSASIADLSGMQLDALDKLYDEDKKASPSYDRCSAVMHHEVRKALEDFCRQDEEFAQAVVQGKSFGECMKAVARGCGSGLSDLEAYRRAVQFYFPGAEIRMTLEIDLIGAAAGKSEETPKGGGILLDLSQFL